MAASTSGDDLLGVCHVALDEEAADLLGQGLALVGLEIRHHHVHAALGQEPASGIPETRGPTRDDRRRAVQIHVPRLLAAGPALAVPVPGRG